MAQKWTYLASSSGADRLQNSDGASIHLSDGTLVFVAFDVASSSYRLSYTTDRATVNTIASWAFNSASNPYRGTGTSGFALCRDSSDNLYVIATNATASTALTVQAYVKGAGYSWTQKATLTSASINGTNTLQGFSAVWCNTGGGTNGNGHLIVFTCDSSGAVHAPVCDAGAALAGSGTLVVSTNAFFYGATTNSTGSNLDIGADGFGATSGIVVTGNGTTSYNVGKWTVSSSGTATTAGIATGAAAGTLSASTKLRAIRYASNAWAVIYPSTTSGRYMAARYSSTAQLTAGVDSGSPASMPLNGGSLAWDAFLDPVASNRVWVIAQGASATVYRLSCALSAGVSWAATATADDTLSPWVAQGTPHLRAVKTPVGSAVDWQVFAETASTPTYALLGDYTSFNTAPNAPTGPAPASGTVDRSVTQRLSWTFSDPDAGDSQSKFDLQWRHKGTADTWNVVSQTTPSNYYDVPASTFPAEDIEWQVRTYDQAGAVGPYSALAYFTAADPATPPTITAPTSGGTVSSNPATVTWSTAGQQGYQVRRVRDNAGVADTTTVYYDTGQITDTSTRTVSVPFETNNRWEWVQVRVQQGGLWSAWSSIRVNVSYTQPATATLVAAGNNTTAAITVTITNPAPSGGQPTVTYNDVYARAVGDTGAGVRIAAGVANNGTATYWTPASGVAYEFLARTFGSNSTSTDSAWTA